MAQIQQLPPDLASMGPQLCSCGNGMAKDRCGGVCQRLQWGRNFAVAETRHAGQGGYEAAQLQWGRNFAVAETRIARLSGVGHVLLQWGRNFAVAETVPHFRHGLLDFVASMGPQLCSCGNSHGHGLVCGQAPASMGPQLCSCGNKQKEKEQAEAKAASMGPQLCSCGNHRPGGVCVWTSRRFNGAATLQLRKRV